MADQLLAAIFGHSQGAAELAENRWAEEEGLEDSQPSLGGNDGGVDGELQLDMNATPQEVVRRIESVILWFVSHLRQGQLPEIDVVHRAAGNRVFTAGGGEGNEEDADLSGPVVLRMQQQMQRRSLVGRHPESAEAVARLFVLLNSVHGMLLAGLQATQREMWYQFKTLEIFRSPRDVGEAIQDAVGVLQVPRSALGITASSKGLVAGRLVVWDVRAGSEVDCAALGTAGVPIPGDVAHITRNFSFQSDAEAVLVIEKDAVFQRLVQQRFFDSTPCILVTGKGVPDLATRAFLGHLTTCLPELRQAGLVDWNPAGVNILCIYRFGSHRMGESSHYALPRLGWLGARSNQLRQADAAAFQELTARDRAMATNLSAVLGSACPDWAEELRQMLSSSSKAEIEALDTMGGGVELADVITACLEQGDCI